MFINKLNSQPNVNFQKMSSYVNVFLKTEISCIPKLLSSIFGEYYNNALCNGASWVFTFWCILHCIFDKCINAILKKLRYREYVRLRLKSGLWYLGFFGTCLVYSVATLDQNDIAFFNIRKVNNIRPVISVNPVKRPEEKIPSPILQNNDAMVPGPLILGHVIISTFYLHSAFWEGFVRGVPINSINYFLLFLFTVVAYITRANEILEVSMKLTTCIAVAQLAVEFTRCYFMSSVQKSFLSKLTAIFIYYTTFIIYVLVHLVIIPLVCIVRLGLSIMSDKPNGMLLFLFFVLIIWLGTEIYHSVLFRFVNHWLYHQSSSQSSNDQDTLDNSTESLNKVQKFSTCDNTLFECSLFFPRDDLAYHLKKIRIEIEERKHKMMLMRKPKNMLLQTLKCMVAIKRKLNEKRLRASPDFDEIDSDSDQSEYNEATDNRTGTVGTENVDTDNASTENVDTDDEGIVVTERKRSSESKDNYSETTDNADETGSIDDEKEPPCLCPKETDALISEEDGEESAVQSEVTANDIKFLEN